MGGDYAPAETVQGALDAASDDLHVILFGDESRIASELALAPPNPAITVVPTTQVVDMDDNPVEGFRRKPDSSLRRAVEAAKNGTADAVVSAGNTGAAHAAALFTLGAVPGIARPAIGSTVPTSFGTALLIDAGANVDCDVENLYQFGVMGSIYIQHTRDISRPTVGLLNIGEENTKGNALAKAAHARLRESHLNFVGNVEARELFAGKADVVVSDRFSGNIALKAGEGVAEMVGGALMELQDEIGAVLCRDILRKLRAKMDYAVYGGAPLLGLNGLCFICHGRSRSFAIAIK